MTRQENGNYPTISGVGSEVGRTAVIADTEQRIERISFHPRFLPAKVIADLTLMLDSPPTPKCLLGERSTICRTIRLHASSSQMIISSHR